MHTKDSVYLSHTTDCIERAYCLHVPRDNSHPDSKTSGCKSEVLIFGEGLKALTFCTCSCIPMTVHVRPMLALTPSPGRPQQMRKNTQWAAHTYQSIVQEG